MRASALACVVLGVLGIAFAADKTEESNLPARHAAIRWCYRGSVFAIASPWPAGILDLTKSLQGLGMPLCQTGEKNCLCVVTAKSPR